MNAILWLIAAMFAVEPILPDRPVPKLVTGAAYREALQREIAATWENMELRSALWRLQTDRGVAVLLDRRIDPNAGCQLRVSGESLRQAFRDLAASAGAETSFPDHLAYIGPAETAKWLLTAIEHAESQLGPESKIAERRRFELSTRRTVHWQDLTTPQEIVQQIATPYRLDVHGIELVPHDLWGSATLPQVSVAEALTLVLVQFDLGWDWQPDGSGVQIKKWEPPPLIERRYTPRGKDLAELQKTWQAALPNATVRTEGRDFIVTGRAEDQQLALALRTTGSVPKATIAKTRPTPLRRRLFTVKLERIPIRALMEDLEKSGVDFIYDETALKNAGISLEEMISLDVKKADADAFLKAVFQPVGLKTEIDDVTVRLTPR